MTEDQILQRVAESQKRVFSDIDSSKQGNSSKGFQVVGANGLNVQQQGNQVAISADSSALQGASGERGEQGNEGPEGPEGEKGDKGDTGENGQQGVGVVSVEASQNLSFTFTLSNGQTITTAPLISGDGVLAAEGGSLTVLQTQSCN